MEDRETPTVSILLLGDPECGKSTFLSRLSHGQSSLTTPSPTTLLTPLHDLDQPFTYAISLQNHRYLFEFSDTSSPQHYTLLTPDVIIICYSISDRRSLVNAQYAWRKEAIRHYNLRRQEWETGTKRGGEGAITEDIPVMLLGLKRDLRVEGDAEGTIYPQEGHRVAQEMRCDRYAECSAVTGELVGQVFEDIAKVAARTTTEDGALSQGGCGVM